MKRNWHFGHLLMSCVVLAATGCTDVQYNYFDGTIGRGASEPSPGKHDIGEQFGGFPKNGSRVFSGFGIAQNEGLVVFVYGRDPDVNGQERLTDANLEKAYFVPPDARFVWPDKSRTIDWTEFTLTDPKNRAKFKGVYPLEGKIHVEKWNGMTDFRVHISARASDPNATRFDGELTTYDHLEFHPLQWVVISLGDLASAFHL